MTYETRLYCDLIAKQNDWRIISFNGVQLPGYFASIERLSCLDSRDNLFNYGSELHKWTCSFEQIGLVIIAPKSTCIDFSEILSRTLLENVELISKQIVEVINNVDCVTLVEHWIRGLRIIKDSSGLCAPCRWYSLGHPKDNHPMDPEGMLKFRMVNGNTSKTALASFDLNSLAIPNEGDKQ